MPRGLDLQSSVFFESTSLNSPGEFREGSFSDVLIAELSRVVEINKDPGIVNYSRITMHST